MTTDGSLQSENQELHCGARGLDRTTFLFGSYTFFEKEPVEKKRLPVKMPILNGAQLVAEKHHEEFALPRCQSQAKTLHTSHRVEVILVIVQWISVVENGTLTHPCSQCGVEFMPNQPPLTRRRAWFQANGIESAAVLVQLLPIQESLEIVLQAMHHHLRRTEDPVERQSIAPLAQSSVHGRLGTAAAQRNHMFHGLALGRKTGKRHGLRRIQGSPRGTQSSESG